MTSGSDISPKHIAFYDPERKGIFIHNDQLKESPFEIGDRSLSISAAIVSDVLKATLKISSHKAKHAKTFFIKT